MCPRGDLNTHRMVRSPLVYQARRVLNSVSGRSRVGYVSDAPPHPHDEAWPRPSVSVHAVAPSQERLLVVRFGIVDLAGGGCGSEDLEDAELEVTGVARVEARELS